MRSLLLSLIYRHSPDNLKIALAAPKPVTFPEFEGMKWLYQPIVKDSDNAIDLMTSLLGEMETRDRQFEASGSADIDSYNAQSVKGFARIICIFDEYADFMAEKEIRRNLESSIKRLGAMARGAGIHFCWGKGICFIELVPSCGGCRVCLQRNRVYRKNKPGFFD